MSEEEKDFEEYGSHSGAKRKRTDVLAELESIDKSTIKLKKTTAPGLDVDYGVVFPKHIANEILRQLEDSIEYFTGDLTKVRVFNKWHPVPRQMSAYGDEGVKYHFSGVTVPAKQWTIPLATVRDTIAKTTGYTYNFVLVNRYKDGSDYMGEHRDNEPEMDPSTPIASVSFGQHRDFVFKHRDARLKGSDKKNIPIIKFELQHGSLLMMNPPTNTYWYHSLPVRKKAPGVRINLTFRKINMKV